MVTFFYEASYTASKYKTSEALLHAQVAILADKYHCSSLYKFARLSFVKTVQTVGSDEWRGIAAFIYDFTTTESPAHLQIRNIVINTVTTRSPVLKSTLQNNGVVELLRSNADLATDLLLGRRHGSTANDASEYLCVCDHCHYSHFGPRDCPNVSSVDGSGVRLCPKCGKGSSGKTTYVSRRVDLYQAYSCGFCDGFHTVKPES
jgi:hypothetical protein